MTWRSALYDYVRHKTRLEAEPLSVLDRSDSMSRSCITDQVEVAQLERANRLAAWYQERQITPVRNELRLTVTHVREMERDVQANIRLRRRFEYAIGGMSHLEYRVESERITLASAGMGPWRVTGIAARDDEQAEAAMLPHTARLRDWQETGAPADPEQAELPTIPYVQAGLYSPYHMPERQGAIYDRDRVKQYADRWWNGANPDYIRFEVDCTNYVSQCIFAGGAPMHYTGKRNAGWWYQGRDRDQELWSYSWSVAHSLNTYLSQGQLSGLRVEIVDQPTQLMIGDVISYDWDGDGRYQHSAIVAAIAADGAPLVNAHTTDSYHRYWDYRDSYAWSDRTRYRFLHLLDGQ